MSVWLALLIGFAGSGMACAFGLLLFEERSPFDMRPPLDFLGLLACLLFNVAGWIVAVVSVG